MDALLGPDFALSAARGTVLVLAILAVRVGVRFRRHWSYLVGPALLALYTAGQLVALVATPGEAQLSKEGAAFFDLGVAVLLYAVARSK